MGNLGTLFPVYVLRGHYELFNILLHAVRVKAHFYEPVCSAVAKQQREADAQAGLSGQWHSEPDTTWQKQKPSRCVADSFMVSIVFFLFLVFFFFSVADIGTEWVMLLHDTKRLENFIRFKRNSQHQQSEQKPNSNKLCSHTDVLRDPLPEPLFFYSSNIFTW